MPITASIILSRTPQIDGRSYVVEQHTDSAGRTHKIEYTANVGLDVNAVMLARAELMGAAIDAKAAALAVANKFELPLGKYEFRQRFTQAEKEACDAFNLSFESNGMLTANQKSAIRSGLADFTAADSVHLSNPSVYALLSLYEAIGLIGAGRAAQIVGGN